MGGFEENRAQDKLKPELELGQQGESVARRRANRPPLPDVANSWRRSQWGEDRVLISHFIFRGA